MEESDNMYVLSVAAFASFSSIFIRVSWWDPNITYRKRVF